MMVDGCAPLTPEEARFMAFTGLIRWAFAVTHQGGRVLSAIQQIGHPTGPLGRLHPAALLQVETHFFSLAAYQLLDYSFWLRELGACPPTVDLSEVDRFAAAIRELRNMREHETKYFRGAGHEQDKWVVRGADFIADGSSLTGDMIGGRLNWPEFTRVAGRLLEALLREPLLSLSPRPSPPRGG
jgi:hypothetical protein